MLFAALKNKDVHMSNYHNIDLHKIARSAIIKCCFDFVLTKPVLDEINAFDSKKIFDVAQDRIKDLRGFLIFR